MGMIAMALATLVSAGAPTQSAPKAPAKAPVVEVVFVLDTTGSMSGLIGAAKEKIWAIANTLAAAKPTPIIRMGLVGYRDRGDEYVTKKVPLSSDLDGVYRELMSFSANGGGDTPESVNQALYEAVNTFAWSKDSTTYRVIFLVGDCPPHMDYADDVKYAVTCQAAAKAGITINTIQCGNDSGTEPIWREIARLAEGKYFRVAQSGGAILAASPYDAELATLAAKLDATCVYFGAPAEQQAQLKRKADAAKSTADAPAPAQARRAAFNASEAGASNLLGQNELIDAVRTGKVALDKVPEEQLPDSIRRLSPADRRRFVEEKARERSALQARVQSLAKQRQAFLEKEAKKHDVGASLDGAVHESLREQTARKDIRLEAKPSY